MKFFATLREKPWEVQTTPPGYTEPDPLARIRIALNFVLAIVGVLFFLFIITYLSRSQYPDFEALAGRPWQPFADTGRLWFNTALLALGSVALQYGVNAARREQVNGAVAGVSAAVFFATAFLVAQFQLWQYLQGMGYHLSGNPANSYFYMLTATHGLHVVGGLVALGNLVFRAWQGDDLAALGARLALCARYWHFLLLVWLLLFALLASPKEAIDTLAAMCGF